MNFLNLWELSGILITIIAAIFSYIKSRDEQKWNSALTISILGLVFSFLISIRYEMLPRIEKAQGIAYQIADSEAITETLHLLLKVKDSKYYQENRIFQEYINDNISSFTTSLRKAEIGEFIVHKDDIPLFSDSLINSASNSITATSYVKSTEWWLSHWGREYENINYRLQRKGIKITRYFIFSNRKEYDEMQDIIRRHIDNQIETYIMFNSESNYIHTEDLILVDGEIAGRLVIDPEKNMKKAVMSLNKRVIRDIENRFKRIKKASRFANDIFQAGKGD